MVGYQMVLFIPEKEYFSERNKFRDVFLSQGQIKEIGGSGLIISG
jgi:hypothetical protein